MRKYASEDRQKKFSKEKKITRINPTYLKQIFCQGIDSMFIHKEDINYFIGDQRNAVLVRRESHPGLWFL